MEHIEFVSNQDRNTRNHAHYFAKAINNAEEIILCAAYWKIEGIKIIESHLKNALVCGIPVEIYASLNEWNTTPDALTALLDLVTGHPKAHLYLCKKSPSIFHPKIYYFRGLKTFTAIIGSANLTKGGLFKNDEASVKVTSNIDTDFHCDLIAYLSDLKIKNMVQPATKELIRNYAEEFNKKNGLRIKRGVISTSEILENREK